MAFAPQGQFVPQGQFIPTGPEVIGHVLKNGASLNPGQALKSLNNDYFAQLNEQGHLFIHQNNAQSPLWTSENNKTGFGPYRATIQNDGNFVIYDANTQPLWASDTWQKGASGHYVRLADDGNLFLYDGNNQATWQTKIQKKVHKLSTHPANHEIGDTLKVGASLAPGQFLKADNFSYYVAFNNHGQISLYNSDHIHEKNAIWTSNNNSSGPGPYRLTTQDDGNLVIYDANNQALWASDTWNKGAKGHYAKVQDDGNFVLYDGHNQATWSSNTYRG